MSKTRSDSKLDALPKNQREQLEGWLFDENLSYKDAVSRLHLDFGLRVSQSVVGDFYQRRAQARMLEKIAASAANASEVQKKFEENPTDFYPILLQMVGRIAFDSSMSRNMDPETLFNFTKLVIAGREHEIKVESLALARDRFQFDAAAACLKKLPSLKVISADVALDQDAKIARIRQELFGA